jgi:DNA topoisomerase-2
MTKTTTTYKSLDQREHILHRPDMYIGSVKNERQEKYITVESDESYRIIKKNMEYNPGLTRLFIEALSNSIDNLWRSKKANIPMTKIKVNVDSERVTIWNDGLHIPVEINEQSGLYIPDMIFGKFLSGSNYDDTEERLTSGRNGVGVKALNAFSKEFTVKVCDPVNGKLYSQTWSENMLNKTKPKISTSKLKNGYTEVSWITDFNKFGCEGFSSKTISLFLKHCLDTAMITNVSVYFNDKKLPVKTLSDYALLFLEEETKEKIVINTDNCNIVLLPNQSGEFESISFVNGIETRDGGVHVDSWSNAIFKPLSEKYSTKKGPQLSVKDIKPFFKLFVNCTVPNPAFNSQEKSKLVSPSIKAEVLPKHINSICKWSVAENISELLKSKDVQVLKKIEKKRGFKRIDGYDPANLSGGKHSKDCTLILCEGLSAKTYAVLGIEVGAYGKKGRNYFGVYALRGKGLNTRNATSSSISKNREITDMIQALNLKYEVDYTKDENFNSLNYGKVMILTDQDDDGLHISGLIMNFFHSMFPSLMKRGLPFIVGMRTPLVRIYTKTQQHVFYNVEELKKFTSNNDVSKMHIKYFKGLGTSSDKEVRDSFGKSIVEYFLDEKADDNMNKAFHSKQSNQRKEWLRAYNPSECSVSFKDTVNKMSISDFINKELIRFSQDDCNRNIPNLIDGLKISQRKILYATILKGLKYSAKTMKVAQLAGFVAESTNYHHGEQCLFDTIVKIAHEFPGSNNIPLLFRDGQFGSRLCNGNDAASARYIFTKLERLTRLLFRPEDDGLLTHIYDEGDKIEPEFYVPIIPTILVNGNESIGTGWSSSIPCYNPLELIDSIQEWLNNNNSAWVNDSDEDIKISVIPELTPWYRDFHGNIERVDGNKFVTTGIMIEEEKNKYNIVELPIGMWTDSMKDHIEQMIEDKKIKSYKNYSTPKKVNFSIHAINPVTPSDMKLKTTISANNMVMFCDGVVKKFDSVDQIIDEFCKVRYRYYVIRKESVLKQLKYECMVLENKRRFLKEVMNDDLIIHKKEEEDVYKELQVRKYYKDDNGYRYLLSMHISSFTSTKLNELDKNIKSLKHDIDALDKKSPADLWNSDLKEFKDEYKLWLSEIGKDYKLN